MAKSMAKTPTVNQETEFLRLLKRFIEELSTFRGTYQIQPKGVVPPEFGKFVKLLYTSSVTPTEKKLLTEHRQLFIAWLKLQQTEK
jgi:hypothetical protein